MRFKPDDTFWVVTDATPDSTLADVCFETSLRGLELQFRGGLSIDRHPTIFTERAEAESEGEARLALLRTAQAVAERAAKAIASARVDQGLGDAARVQILGRDGAVLLDADLQQPRPVS